MDAAVPKSKTRFLKVKCPGCGNEQIVFSAASSNVKCLVCNKELAKSSASGIKLKSKLVKELSE